ncbi:MAG TPA: UbiD family decarboxylase [Caldilineae bacterium]|nr:UbiD family decarboxylase [Caldilineae bacterium]
MNLREFLNAASEKGWLVRINRPVDPELELAAVAYALDGRPVLFENVVGHSGWRVVTGVASARKHFALALEANPGDVIFRLAEAQAHPLPAPVVDDAPCQEVVHRPGDLDTLPILKHLPDDAGPYVTAGVAIVRDPDTGLNASYHRLLPLDERHVAARLVEHRGAYNAWKKTERDLPIAIAIGLPLHVLLAASMSPPAGVFEMDIAQALAPTPLARCLTNDLLVPAEAEIVLEGRLTHRLAAEGPFVDLTETSDIVRQQPVIVIDAITHRRDPIYHALLPGQLEHKLLMGMPKEPGIYAAVREVADVRNVHITPGGASWLHAVVQIAKRHPDDGRRAIEAAYRGHGSLKHVVVVDEDIDIFDPNDVEWAIATRVQAGRDVIIFRDQPSSSLDPSARHVPGQKSRSDKAGVDATIPWDAPGGPSHPEHFRRIPFPKVNLADYLP